MRPTPRGPNTHTPPASRRQKFPPFVICILSTTPECHYKIILHPFRCFKTFIWNKI